MIKGTTRGQRLTLERDFIVADTIKYLTAHFDLSEDWSPYTVYAHFAKNGSEIASGPFELDEDGCITENAALNLTKGCWDVWLHGNRTDSAGTVHRIASNVVGLQVIASGVANGNPFPTLTPSVVETQVEQAHGYADEAEDAKDAAVAAKEAAEDAAGSITAMTWNTLPGKPNSFPPSAHQHSYSEITNTPSIPEPTTVSQTLTTGTEIGAVNGVKLYAPEAPATTWSAITGKPDTFPPATHQHSYNSLTGKPDTFTPSAHQHLYSDITDPPTIPEAYDDTELQRRVDGLDENVTSLFGEIAKLGSHVIADRVSSLNNSEIVADHIIDSFGSPAYIGTDDIVQYSAYGIEEPGWYVFTRITSADGENVTGVTVIGADGFIISGNHVDIAVRFGASPESKKVTINWGAKTETFLFRATDLAISNLDQRVTFYVYDISDFLTWEWTPATDTTAVADKIYYDENHNKIELAVDDPVPSGSVIHSKCIIEGFTRNISYSSPLIDCPVEIHVPEIEDNGYGAWFEIQASFAAAYSVTVIPPEGVSVSTTFVQSPDKGINMLNLQYHISTKTWMIANNKWAVK